MNSSRIFEVNKNIQLRNQLFPQQKRVQSLIVAKIQVVCANCTSITHTIDECPTDMALERQRLI